ncbi:MAG: biotin--[acetyl-CoA-carboxylase] ligase, partial [Actinomycetes bacterium]
MVVHASPDPMPRVPLDAEFLRASVLASSRLWTELTVATSVGSTNVEMADRARRGAPHGEVLVAEEQTAGRGRRDRGWIAPAFSSAMLSV